jgi:hypothetical protein
MFLFNFLRCGGTESSYVRRPLIGLLYQPRIIDDDCGAIGGMRIGRETEVLGENLSQRHFVHHKSH